MEVVPLISENNKNHHKAMHSKVPKYIFLDGLRGLSVLAVIYQHLEMHDSPLFGNIGNHAVICFFVLSSFLLSFKNIKDWTSFLEKNPLTFRGVFFFWFNYLLNRVFRIYPAFVVVLLCLQYSTWLQDAFIVGKFDFFSHLFLIDCRHIFWTIPPEFAFYLINPFIIMAYHFLFKEVRFKSSKVRFLYHTILVLLASLALNLIKNYCMFLYFNRTPETWSITRFLFVFMVGSISGIAWFEATSRNVNLEVFPIICQVLNALCFLIFIVLTMIVDPSLKGLLDLEWWNRDIHDSVAISSIILIGLLTDRSFSKLFQWNFLVFMSQISYSFYLIHPAFVRYVRLYWKCYIPREDARSWNGDFYFFAFLLTVLLTIPFAFILKHSVETIGITIGNRISAKIKLCM